MLYFYKHIKLVISILYRICMIRLFSIFPICHNKIIFCSYHGRKYSDSPKYISEKLQEIIVKEHKKIDIVWIINSDIAIPRNVRSVKPGSLHSLYELATAKIWVDNARKELWVRKRKKQYYIQTWHGGTALKKVEKDAEDKLHRSYIKRAILDSKMANVFLSESKWNTNMYKGAFWYTGQIWESGLPRLDIFYKEDLNNLKSRVKNYFHISGDEHIVIYAPTFRNNNEFSLSKINYTQLISTLNFTWGHNWKLIIRLHPNWCSKQDELSYNSDVLNGSNYPEINELILASDLLITDYSSCMFDAMEAKKSVILFAPDIQDYTRERGFYFQFSQLPFPLAKNQEELIECIRDFDFDVQTDKVQNFMVKLGFVNDGKASERVANFILEKM